MPHFPFILILYIEPSILPLLIKIFVFSTLSVFRYIKKHCTTFVFFAVCTIKIYYFTFLFNFDFMPYVYPMLCLTQFKMWFDSNFFDIQQLGDTGRM